MSTLAEIGLIAIVCKHMSQKSEREHASRTRAYFRMPRKALTALCQYHLSLKRYNSTHYRRTGCIIFGYLVTHDCKCTFIVTILIHQCTMTSCFMPILRTNTVVTVLNRPEMDVFKLLSTVI